MQRRYWYRVESTSAQRQVLARVFGCARVVFNDAVRAREDARARGERITVAEVQRRVVTAAKHTPGREFLAAAPGVALVQACGDARRAYKNFFASRAGRRAGRRVGRPRLKSKKDHRCSIRFTRNGFAVRPSGKLFVAKVGEMRVRWSRGLPSVPSSVTMIREPDGHYYASFVVEVVPEPLPVVGREAGLDLGVQRLATVADTAGHRTDIANPKYLARKLRKLRRAQRRQSRRQRGSRNWDTARHHVATQHGKVARARRDHHHKQALWLARETQTVHLETLNVAGMVRNRRLARAISDAGWGQFTRIIAEKAERYGREVHPIDRWHPSSKLCSACGHRVAEMPLQVRAWVCPGCVTVHDRDHNAAINILAAGRAERQNTCGAHVTPNPDPAAGAEAGTSGNPRGSTAPAAA